MSYKTQSSCLSRKGIFYPDQNSFNLLKVPHYRIFKPATQLLYIKQVFAGLKSIELFGYQQPASLSMNVKNWEDVWVKVGTVWHILWCLQVFCCSVLPAVGRLWLPRQQLKLQAASSSTFRPRRWQTCGTGSHRSWPPLSSHWQSKSSPALFLLMKLVCFCLV